MERTITDNNQSKGVDRLFHDPKVRNVFIAVLAVVIVLAGILIWKAIQIENMKEEAEKDRVALQANAREAVIQTHRQHLKLLVVPYVWAIRTEMMRGNIDQLNTYANEMIKEKNFQNIVVADEKGMIISSTNKKFEGQAFTTVGKQSYLASDTVTIDPINANTLVAASPIMGFNNRLGALMITYRLPDGPFGDSTATKQKE